MAADPLTCQGCLSGSPTSQTAPRCCPTTSPAPTALQPREDQGGWCWHGRQPKLSCAISGGGAGGAALGQGAGKHALSWASPPSCPALNVPINCSHLQGQTLMESMAGSLLRIDSATPDTGAAVFVMRSECRTGRDRRRVHEGGCLSHERTLLAISLDLAAAPTLHACTLTASPPRRQR